MTVLSEDRAAAPAGRRQGIAFARLRSVAVDLLTPVVSVFAFWYVLVFFSGLPDFVVPRPESVVLSLYNDRAYLGFHLFETLKSALAGLVLANVLGFGLAALFVLLPPLRRVLMPIAITLRNIPYVVLITVLVLALGDGLVPKILVVTLSGFFPVLVNCYRGLLSTDPLVLDRLHVLNASRWTVFCRVRVPCSLPYFVAAQEITGSAAIITTIAAEWMMSSSGLGYVINRAMALYRGDQVYAVALLASLLSYGLYALVRHIGTRLDWEKRQLTKGDLR